MSRQFYSNCVERAKEAVKINGEKCAPGYKPTENPPGNGDIRRKAMRNARLAALPAPAKKTRRRSKKATATPQAA